ncbi:hypothetical protein [Actinomadura sp. WMMB 499]|uniref:hypothetical protein n=1 Tax=Actinomadura sp. WMMB 499 TaxID=1219491 RepID=UPI0020C75AEA|nr:hypothetical protein [Actinomadura sp. WMMB 499]
MTATRSMPPTESDTTPRDVPRWAIWCAWITVLCTVPSGIWRTALGFGADVGFTGELGEMYTGTDIMVYVLVLTVASQAAAFLTLGLVRPWGSACRDGSRSSATGGSHPSRASCRARSAASR